MSQQIDAIYDKGILRPLLPVSLPEKSHVRITVTPASEAGAIDSRHKTNDRETTDPEQSADDFDAELDELLFDGPSLPAAFSRAEIYP
jgi:predicted DNA-binding antitoxin AbrB/MazE fold protein